MALTAKDCAALALAIYSDPAASGVTWDHLDTGADDDGVYWAIKIVNGVIVPVFRGSDNLGDWLRDVMALTKPWGAPGLGPVHPGFFLGMDRVWAEFKGGLMAGASVVPVGHSLGAGRVCDLTGLMVLDGKPPSARVCFGEPRPGFQQLADLIKPVPAFSYRAGEGREHDSVTGVPWYLPPEDYVHPGPLIDLDVTPIGSPLDPFRFHQMALYAEAAPPDVVIP